MKTLFLNTDAELCSLVDYVKTFVEVENEDNNLFQLPPIQRNAVWNVAQIERLWDSILRGFPIGSFLVAPREIGRVSRDVFSGIQKQSAKEGYFLLDGQQRTRAILLAFCSNLDSRIWIDLNPSITFDNEEFNDRKFLVRVITSYQPWGMSDRDPKEKLSENQKYNARKELGVNNIHYDYQVEIDNGMVPQKEKYSWPVRATLPIPLDILVNLCGGTTGKIRHPSWEEIIKFIPERYHNRNLVPDEPTEHFKDILQALQKILDLNTEGFQSRSVVLLYQSETKEIKTEKAKDSVEVLFTRVNAGGTTLQGEEMAYSLLKSSWDGAYDMVSSIVKSEKIGYLLSATNIVMSATRLARFIKGDADNPNPGITNFRKWIGERDEKGSFLETMKNLLSTKNDEKSLIYRIIETFCDLVIYNEIAPSDIGLPKKLLLAINQSHYQPVFVWIYRHLEDKELIRNNRASILRYLIFCYLTIDKHQRASKVAVDLIRKTDPINFPDKEIYSAFVENEYAFSIATPDEFFKPFNVPVDGFFRHNNDVFNIEGDAFNSCRYWFWESKELLLWFQRSYAAKWFEGYNPMSGDHYDTPYDWDHIVPYSHLITSGGSPNTHSKDKELNNKFSWNRHRYINSIGNFRLWPFWANRGDNNSCHTYKLRMESPDWARDNAAKELGLNSTQDFLKASSIKAEDEELWYNAGGDARDWPQVRRESWQKAVENRVLYLYSNFYEDFGFASWQ